MGFKKESHMLIYKDSVSHNGSIFLEIISYEKLNMWSFRLLFEGLLHAHLKSIIR